MPLTAVDRVHAVMKKHIHSGISPPNSRVREASNGRDLDLGRTPMRAHILAARSAHLRWTQSNNDSNTHQQGSNQPHGSA